MGPLTKKAFVGNRGMQSGFYGTVVFGWHISGTKLVQSCIYILATTIYTYSGLNPTSKGVHLANRQLYISDELLPLSVTGFESNDRLSQKAASFRISTRWVTVTTRMLHLLCCGYCSRKGLSDVAAAPTLRSMNVVWLFSEHQILQEAPFWKHIADSSADNI